MITLPRILTTAALAIGLVGLVVFGLDAWRQHKAEGQGQQVQQHVQEADHHAGAAEAIPDHAQELAETKAEVARLKAKLAKITGPLPSLPPVVAPGVGEPDGTLVDQLHAANVVQGVLIEAQDRQIKGLELALSDEQKRSSEWRKAFESERKARQAQDAATQAWKDAVKSSRWSGRVEGFAAGVALGYLTRGQR